MKILVIGAGPAGLTAAYEILLSGGHEVIIFEQSNQFGGISKTINYKGNRMDMGGHRFFSKVPEVNSWWEKMLPLQGFPAYDDLILNRKSDIQLKPGGPDPEVDDRVMLVRNRTSRIYFQGKFFDYPISLNWKTIKNMGIGTTFLVGCSYMKSIFHKPEDSLEDFYINRFGKKLYSMFFEHYTENLWGRHPSDISSEWGAQRVKGLSITTVLKDIIGKKLHVKKRNVETSLIEKFHYPKLGPGELWDITAAKIEKLGGCIITNARVIGIHKNDHNMFTEITYEKNGEIKTESGDILISSMALKDLVAGMNDVPERPAAVAAGLPYRDYITVGVLLSHLNLINQTDVKTIGNIIPDNWVYVHDANVRMGRFQIYNNWSPYMVKDIEHTIWMGLEYFCNEGDEMWAMPDEAFAHMAIDEMIKLKLIISKKVVLDYHVERVRKAYPAYFDTYKDINVLREYLDTIPNLYCIGRNGQHRYNNIDHSMMTAFEVVKNINNGITEKSNIWNVNTEADYHEESKNLSGGNRCL